MTATQLREELITEISTLSADEKFFREAIELLRNFIESQRVAESAPIRPKKKVKDMTDSDKKEFLKRLCAKEREDNPNFYAMIDGMKLTEEEINDPDERTQYILSK